MVNCVYVCSVLQQSRPAQLLCSSVALQIKTFFSAMFDRRSNGERGNFCGEIKCAHVRQYPKRIFHSFFFYFHSNSLSSHANGALFSIQMEFRFFSSCVFTVSQFHNFHSTFCCTANLCDVCGHSGYSILLKRPHRVDSSMSIRRWIFNYWTRVLACNGFL